MWFVSPGSSAIWVTLKHMVKIDFYLLPPRHKLYTTVVMRKGMKGTYIYIYIYIFVCPYIYIYSLHMFIYQVERVSVGNNHNRLKPTFIMPTSHLALAHSTLTLIGVIVWVGFYKLLKLFTHAGICSRKLANNQIISIILRSKIHVEWFFHLYVIWAYTVKFRCGCVSMIFFTVIVI